MVIDSVDFGSLFQSYSGQVDTMSAKTLVYDGGGRDGGRKTSKFLHKVLFSMASDARDLVMGGKELPEPERHDTAIGLLQTRMLAVEAILLQGGIPFPGGEGEKEFQAAKDLLKEHTDAKKEEFELRQRMTAAGDAGLTFIKANAGEAIMAIVSANDMARNSMVQLRDVFASIRATYGGIPAQVVASIKKEMKEMPVIKNRKGALSNLNTIIRLRLEFKLFREGLPEGARGRISSEMTDSEAVDHLRERISGKSPDADSLQALRQWWDENDVEPRTFAEVKAKIVLFSQKQVCALGEEEEEEEEEDNTNSHHLANSASQGVGGGGGGGGGGDMMVEAVKAAQMIANMALEGREGVRQGGAGGGGSGYQQRQAGQGRLGQQPILPSRVKSGVCWNWEESGSCTFGDNCNFIHRSEEERAAAKRQRV